MLNLNSIVSPFKPNQIQILASNGEWSLHDLLPIALSFCGKSSVSVASFSLSEEAVRTFYFEKEKGSITYLRCLFDYTMRSHKIDLMLFLENVSNEVRTTPNHAKIMLIENDNWNIAIIGSANLTTNPRLELYALLINRPEFLEIKNIFESAWTKAIPYS